MTLSLYCFVISPVLWIVLLWLVGVLFIDIRASKKDKELMARVIEDTIIGQIKWSTISNPFTWKQQWFGENANNQTRYYLSKSTSFPLSPFKNRFLHIYKYTEKDTVYGDKIAFIGITPADLLLMLEKAIEKKTGKKLETDDFYNNYKGYNNIMEKN